MLVGLGSGLRALDGTVNIYGGSFTGGNAQNVPGSDGEQLGGDGLFDDGGNLNVYGGSFTGGRNGFGDIDVLGGATTLYGSDFFVNGVAMSSSSVTGSGTITANLQDNSGATTFTYEVFGGTLNLAAPQPVPEASTTVSFGLLLALGLGGMGDCGEAEESRPVAPCMEIPRIEMRGLEKSTVAATEEAEALRLPLLRPLDTGNF